MLFVEGFFFGGGGGGGGGGGEGDFYLFFQITACSFFRGRGRGFLLAVFWGEGGIFLSFSKSLLAVFKGGGGGGGLQNPNLSHPPRGHL